MTEKSASKAGAKGKVMAGLILLAAVGGLAVLMLHVVFGFGDPVGRNNRAFSKEVKEWVSQAREGEQIQLSELTPFSWNTACTFDPYTTKEEMARVLGCSEEGLQETVNEGMVQLIFVDYDSVSGENKVVCCICGYGSSLGYGIDLGTRFDRRSSCVAVSQGMDQMTLRAEGEYPCLMFEGETFEGVITELYGQSALVSVEEGWPIRSSGDQVVVGLDEKQQKAAVPGDWIKVNYDGMVMESDPLQLSGQMDTVILKE